LSRIKAIGARQFVVHEAFETIRCSGFSDLVVDAHHDHGVDLVLGGNRQDDLLRAGREMPLELLPRQQRARRLDDDVHAELAPRDLRRVPLLGHEHLLAADRHRVAIRRDVLVKNAHHGVVLQEIRQVRVVIEVVDRRDLDVVAVREDAEHRPSDPAEAVDADPDHAASRVLSSCANRWMRSTAR
jgi:hypothetical protein